MSSIKCRIFPSWIENRLNKIERIKKSECNRVNAKLAALVPKKLPDFYETLLYYCYTLPLNGIEGIEGTE